MFYKRWILIVLQLGLAASMLFNTVQGDSTVTVTSTATKPTTHSSVTPSTSAVNPTTAKMTSSTTTITSSTSKTTDTTSTSKTTGTTSTPKTTGTASTPKTTGTTTTPKTTGTITTPKTTGTTTTLKPTGTTTTPKTTGTTTTPKTTGTDSTTKTTTATTTTKKSTPTTATTTPGTTTPTTSTVQPTTSTTTPTTLSPEQRCPQSIVQTSDSIEFSYSAGSASGLFWTCESVIDISSGLSLLLDIDSIQQQVGNNSLLIDDMGYGRGVQRLFTYDPASSSDDSDPGPFRLASYSPSIRLLLNYSDPDSSIQLNISYHNITDDMVTTVLTNHTGWISDEGNSYNPVVNYQHEWIIRTTPGDFVLFYVENLNLDYVNGDFLAIGRGNTPFEEAPALMLAANRTAYPSVEVTGSEAYVFLFSKSFTADCNLTIFYNTTGYTPPSIMTPTTVLPPAVLNATITYDGDTDDFNTVMESFSDAMTEFVALQCNNTNVFVNISEAVYIEPCMVLVYEVVIANGSCNGDPTFSLADYNALMGNYSEDIQAAFGRSIMTSCPYDITVWVVSIVVVLLFALIIMGCVAYNRSEANKGRAVKLRRMTMSQDVDVLSHLYPGIAENPAFGIDNPSRLSEEDEPDERDRYSQAPQRSNSVMTDVSMFNRAVGAFGYDSRESSDISDDDYDEHEIALEDEVDRFRIMGETLRLPTGPPRSVSFSQRVSIVMPNNRRPKMEPPEPTAELEVEHQYDSVQELAIQKQALQERGRTGSFLTHT